MLCLVASGCRNELPTRYGQRSGPGASTSVNGTAVLADMFEQSGHEVLSWQVLSPRLAERADCIVWFPDDYAPPSEQVRDWLERWLYQAPNRTLIYVGRDFDAAPFYWEKIKPDAAPGQQAEIDRRLAEARSHLGFWRADIPDSEDCEWFTVEGPSHPRKVRTLAGDDDWLRGVDASKLEIELDGRMLAAPRANVVLKSEGDMLVSIDPWDTSQLIVVANGSFLLNLPLVNHEHRKLAAKLIRQIGPPRKTVVFLESRHGGPPIVAEDPDARTPSGLDILFDYPMNWIFAHFALLGAIFCFSRWPIFGVPRQLEAESAADFGKHIEALAELLRRSRDRSYAVARVMHYHQTVSPETNPKSQKL